MKKLLSENCFMEFEWPVDTIPRPKRFIYPFNYEPHPLSVLAAQQLQKYLETQTEWEHDFGIENSRNDEALGKMFGVLVVQSKDKEIGFLAAYSGKLADRNDHPGFVPPIYNLLDKEGFFRKEEAVITHINHKIEVLEKDAVYLKSKKDLQDETEFYTNLLQNKKRDMKVTKKSGIFIVNRPAKNLTSINSTLFLKS